MGSIRFFLLIAGTLLLAGCNQAVDMIEIPTSVTSVTATKYPTEVVTPRDIPTSTPQPAQTLEATPIKEQTLPSGDSIQAVLFGLAPPDSLSAGYCDFQMIREDPELKSAFAAVPNVCSDSFSIPNGRVDQLIAFGRRPDVSTRVMMGIIYVL
jgi:hypothetical protein